MIVTKFAGGKSDLLFVPLSASGASSTPRLLRATPANEADGRFSPDGRWWRSAPTNPAGTKSTSRSLTPTVRSARRLWCRSAAAYAAGVDERRPPLFYYSEPDKVMSVAISVAPKPEASAPVLAFDLKRLRVDHGDWDIMPDGRLLAIQKGEGEDDITAFSVVLELV